ncbi:hypothetical protein [Nocardia brevicatena]|uniref:hypothetical protein n=1 Tax=Nocardia brevicatena TaxID=37327 RepID=UPI0002D89A23|nr:hypothetical protein [Nocardia brevicatena]
MTESASTRNLSFMAAKFDDMNLRDLVGLLTEEEQRELRPSVLRVLNRLPDPEVLRRELNMRMARV